MKALITAGGRATRLRPLTWTINKHLIPLANKPMIFNAIEKIVDAGVFDIAININPGETEIQKVVGDGSRWGAKITYIEQTGGPKGLAHILNVARDYLGDDDFIFYLGDNIILGSIKKFIDKFRNERPNGLLALSKVSDPKRFGVPVFEGNRIIRVDEKPENPQSDFAVTGIYVYDKNVFKAVDAIEPSARGEYEISDVHTWLINNGYLISYEEITGWWKDTGKPEDLLEGNQLLLSEMTREQVSNFAQVDSEAIIHGRVQIGQGTVIKGRCLIRGPVAIGENCVIDKSYIGPYTSIGNNVQVINAEIEHSIVFDDVVIRCPKRIIDGLIGRGASLVSATESLPTGHKLIVGDNSIVEL